MKKKLNKNIQRYIGEIAREIPFYYPGRRKYISSYQKHLMDNANEYDNISYEEFCEILGSPIIVAEEFKDSLDNSQIRSTKHKLIALLVIIAVFVVSSVTYLQLQYHAPKGEYTIEFETKIIE